MLPNMLQYTGQHSHQRPLMTKMATMPRLGTTVLEQFISIEKKFKMKTKNFQGLFLVHCFLNPSVLGVPSVVLVHELETFEFLGMEVKTLWMAPKFPFSSSARTEVGMPLGKFSSQAYET